MMALRLAAQAVLYAVFCVLVWLEPLFVGPVEAQDL